MTKSTITRERIQRIIRAINSEAYDEEEIRGWLSSDEIMELSRMALAAMDSSESVELPLDYLQGHKDGLEFASQLAEANHPETGDWLYDDPIELAKAIRKGPDMPPVQPVADREPDRNPVLAYADSYRDMAKQGVESVPIWSVITDLERNIAPLYRHAQPVPVVPYDFDFDRFNDVVWLECVASNPHMHSPTTSIIARVALELNKRILAGNSPVIPDSSVIGWLRTDYQRDFQVNCTAPQFVMGKNDPSSAWGVQYMPVTKAGGQQNSPQNIPEIIPQWIPVSERMPEGSEEVLCAKEFDGPGDWRKKVGYRLAGKWTVYGASWTPTHWMPLPAAPQEEAK